MTAPAEVLADPPPVGSAGRRPGSRSSAWGRAAVLLLVTVVAVLAAATVEPPAVADVRDWLERGGPVAWVLLVLALALALVTPAPRSALSVVVGVVAGFWAGLLVVVLAAVLGGLAGYVLSRWLGRAAVLRLAGDGLARFEQRLDRRAFLALVVARVSPVPFVVVSYAAGLSGVRLAPYVLATTVGAVPGSVLYVGIGTSLTVVGEWATGWPAVVALGVLAAVAASGAVRWRRHRDLSGPPSRRAGLPTGPDRGQDRPRGREQGRTAAHRPGAGRPSGLRRGGRG